MDKEEALQALKKDQEERVEKCTLVIQEALKTYNCILSASVLVTENGNIPRISINPR